MPALPRCFALLLALALSQLTLVTKAQTGPPPGGFLLREVATLRRVPEPAGGLIPYRQGKLWGFADSTGQVWVQPSLTAEPTFFACGLASVDLLQPINERMSRRLGTVLLNAQGECLRLAPSQSALLRPDSTLEKRSTADIVGQRIVESVYFARDAPYWDIGRARPTWSGASYRAPGMYAKHMLRRHQGYLDDRYSLHDAQGKPLNKQLYTTVHGFVGPWAKFEGDNYNIQQPGTDQGIVDRHGREVGGRFYYVGDYSATLAVVVRRPEEGAGLLDTTGRFVLGPSAEYSYGLPDSAGLIIRATLRPGRNALGPTLETTGYTFVRLDGQAAFPDLPPISFVGQVSGFGTNDRRPLGPDLALLAAPSGIGILDRTGHWRVAPRYQSLTLYTEMKRGRASFVPYKAYYDDPERTLERATPPDLGVVVATRDKKVGIVRLRDGQEVIPARYDPADSYPSYPLWPLYRGFAGLARDGHHYLVNSRGEEVAEGRYTGWDFRIRGQRYLYLELDKPYDQGGQHWALVDTAGHPLLPPLTRPSLLKGVSPAGLLLVQYIAAPGTSYKDVTEEALNPQGQVVLRGRRELASWHGLVLASAGERADGTLLHDASGQPLRPTRLFQADSLPYARLLVGHLRPPGTPGDSLLVLDRRGHRWAQLPTTWQLADYSSRTGPARWRGQLLVALAADKRRLGYVTRGGRALWQD